MVLTISQKLSFSRQGMLILGFFHTFLTSKNLLCENVNRNKIKKSGHEWFDPKKISEFLKKNGFQIIKVNAFNFYKNQTKDFKKSENFFLYAKYSK